MDPISQAITGAAPAGLLASKSQKRIAIALGAMAGMAPDLDILIRSDSDPLLALEYHRHFTHALPFAPVGALICAAFFYLFPLVRGQLNFKLTYLFCLAGYATHGLLDACTSYGTRLWWPFDQVRVAWDVIAIIDLFYTLPALILIGIACWKRSQKLLAVALIWMLAYLGLGFVQNERVKELANAYIAEQGGKPEILTARPTMSNLWLWRVVYREGDRYHMMGVYAPFWPGGVTKYFPGESAQAVTDAELRRYPKESVLAYDIGRFSHFSSHFLGKFRDQKGRLVYGDVRYGNNAISALPLWGIVIPEDCTDCHVERVTLERSIDLEPVGEVLSGEKPSDWKNGGLVKKVHVKE
jgi:inner membrane protein